MTAEEYSELQKQGGSKQISSSNVTSSEYDTMSRLLFESVCKVVKNHYTGSCVEDTAAGYEITTQSGKKYIITLKTPKP